MFVIFFKDRQMYCSQDLTFNKPADNNGIVLGFLLCLQKKVTANDFFQIFCGGFLLRKINRASFHLVLFLQKQKVCNGTTHKTIYNTTFIYRNVLLY